MTEPNSNSDLLSLQTEVEQLRRELTETQRMAALGELTSTTTHEFNNVLMTILNYAKLGLRHKDEPTRDKALTKILAAAQRAEKVANSVLGMARNRSDDFAPTDLGKLVEESLVLLEREMQKYRVAVQLTIDEVPPIRAVGNQIQQVLLNLMTNARQAMPNGGTLVVKVAVGEADTVDLVVQDTGEGISQDKLPHIFERFYTTKQGPDATGKGGAGVGLSACRDIVQAHRGKIRVESTVGKGTAFTIRLPLAEESLPSAAPITPLGAPVEA